MTRTFEGKAFPNLNYNSPNPQTHRFMVLGATILITIVLVNVYNDVHGLCKQCRLAGRSQSSTRSEIFLWISSKHIDLMSHDGSVW